MEGSEAFWRAFCAQATLLALSSCLKQSGSKRLTLPGVKNSESYFRAIPHGWVDFDGDEKDTPRPFNKVIDVQPEFPHCSGVNQMGINHERSLHRYPTLHSRESTMQISAYIYALASCIVATLLHRCLHRASF